MMTNDVFFPISENTQAENNQFICWLLIFAVVVLLEMASNSLFAPLTKLVKQIQARGVMGTVIQLYTVCQNPGGKFVDDCSHRF